MKVVFLISVCVVGAWGAPTTVAPTTTAAPDKSAELSSESLNSKVKVAANATNVDKKIFPYNNQGFGLPYPGFQGAQSPFGNGFGLNPSFSPYGSPYGQYPGGQNVLPQGLYSPQNPFYNQGNVQPAQVFGQPGQSPDTQGFQQNPLQPGQSPQLPPGLFPQGQLPQGPYPQGPFPPNQFPQQQFPQNQFPQAQPQNPDNSGNNNNGGNPPQTPVNTAGGSNDAEANGASESESDSADAGAQKEKQDGSSESPNPSSQPNRENPNNGQGQLPGQFRAGLQRFPQTLTGAPEFFRNGGPALNQNFFSPAYQFLPNGQLLPQGQFDGQLLTPGVFAGQGNGPTQLYPNQPQNPQSQGQFFQRPPGGSPQNAQSPQGVFPQGIQGGFPPGFQAGYPQVPHGVFTTGPQGAFVPNQPGALPPGSERVPQNQGGFPVNPNPNVPAHGLVPENPGQTPQESAAPGDSNSADPSSTQTRGVVPAGVPTNGGIVSDAPVRPLQRFKQKRPIALPVKIKADSSMKVIPPPGSNQGRPFPADQTPQPSQGSELRSPPGGLYKEVAPVGRPPTREIEGTTTTPRPATRRPDP